MCCWCLFLGFCFVFKLLVSNDKKLIFQVAAGGFTRLVSRKLRLQCWQKKQSCLDAIAASLSWPKHFWDCVINYIRKIICIEANPGGPCIFLTYCVAAEILALA